MRPFRLFSASAVVTWTLIALPIDRVDCRAETQYELTPHGREQAGAYLHDKIFGDNGPETWLFGPKPTYTGWPPRRVSSPRVAQREAAPQSLRFDAFNLQVKLPGGPWERSKPEAVDARARLVLSRLNPNIVISLAAERAKAGAHETNATFLAASQTKLLALPGGEILPGEEEIVVNGIEGIMFKASALVENRVPVHYAIWVAARNGFKYNVAAYGEQRDRDAIDEALLRFLGSIKQIEPHRVARTVDIRKER